MTDIAQARESAISAETKIEALFTSVLDRMHAINSRLAELHDEIKVAQPVSSGSVCLELYRCGPGCSGCPHPRWLKYTWTAPKDNSPGLLVGTNLDAQHREPVLALARNEPHYKKTAELVREAKSLISARAALLTRIRALKYLAR